MTVALPSISLKGAHLLRTAAVGAVSGASLGMPHGWAVVHLTLTVLMVAIVANRVRPALAAAHAGAFVAGLVLAGHWGGMVSAPQEVLSWTIALNLIAVLMQAALAASTTFLVCRLRIGPALLGLVALPAIWVLREWVSLGLPWSLPWVALGYVHAPSGPFAGVFPIGGVLLVSWAAAFAAGATALAWTQPNWRARLARVTAVVLVTLGARRGSGLALQH